LYAHVIGEYACPSLSSKKHALNKRVALQGCLLCSQARLTKPSISTSLYTHTLRHSITQTHIYTLTHMYTLMNNPQCGAPHCELPAAQLRSCHRTFGALVSCPAGEATPAGKFAGARCGCVLVDVCMWLSLSMVMHNIPDQLAFWNCLCMQVCRCMVCVCACSCGYLHLW